MYAYMMTVIIVVGTAVMFAGGIALGLGIAWLLVLYACNRVVDFFKLTDVVIGTARYRRDARESGYIDREAVWRYVCENAQRRESCEKDAQ